MSGKTETLGAGRPCPCTSGERYADCCRPAHRGLANNAFPETATALMRSRYAAFALGDVDYLDRTQHPDHVDQQRAPEERRRSLRAFCRSARFPGLTILDATTSTDGTDGADGTDGMHDTGAHGAEEAFVLFHARVFIGRTDRSFLECSRFRRHPAATGGWRYLDGELEDAPAGRDLADLRTIAGFRARPGAARR